MLSPSQAKRLITTCSGVLLPNSINWFISPVKLPYLSIILLISIVSILSNPTYWILLKNSFDILVKPLEGINGSTLFDDFKKLAASSYAPNPSCVWILALSPGIFKRFPLKYSLYLRILST